MTPQAAIDALRRHAVEGKALQMAAYHKVERPYLGVTNPMIDLEVKNWRSQLDIAGRVDLADALWQSNIFEARIAAAKLLTQARMHPDDAVWALIESWVPGFNNSVIADHACMAGRKRLQADPTRVDEVELWSKSPHMWSRRAALVITLPWTRQNHPKAADLKIRDRVLGWAAAYVDDNDWFIQKAIAWWLCDLSKHDPARARAFLAKHGDQMKPFARKEAAKYLL